MGVEAKNQYINILFVEIIIWLRVQIGINLHEWVFQKVSKFNEPAGGVKFEFLKKNHAEYKLILNWMRKVIWLLINNIHEKINGRSVTGSKGSCLLCWMFGNSLDNLGKSTRVQKKTIPTSFQNFWKSSEVFEKNWKMSQSAQDNLFMKYSENFGNLSQSA